MYRIAKKIMAKHSQRSDKKRKSKIAARYYGKGADLVSFLTTEFGVEIVFYSKEREMKKYAFPGASEYEEEKAQQSSNWILIYEYAIDISIQKVVCDFGGMCVSISDLIVLYESTQHGKLPLVLNEIANAYSSVIVCGASSNADRIYEFFSRQCLEKTKKVSPDGLAGEICSSSDQIIIIADLLPDLFGLLNLPRSVFITWQNMVGNVCFTDEQYDICQNIIPLLLEKGVRVGLVTLPRLSLIKRHRIRTFSSIGFWRVRRDRNFKSYIKNTYVKFKTEELTEEHLDRRVLRSKGYAETYHNGEFVNYDNGFRRTIGGKADYKRRVFFFGPCIIMGAYVSDIDTIPSIMQKALGDEYLLLNRGQPNSICLNLLMRNTEFRTDDIVLYFGKETSISGCTHCDLSVSYDKISHLSKHITDNMMHCDAMVNRQIAEDLLEFFAKNYRDNSTAIEAKPILFGPTIKSIPELYMLNNPEFEKYIDSIKPYCKEGNNGSIVMNCNPFTYGHLYLITEAAKRVDTLYIFVVEEDKSFFPFRDRIELVKQGTAHLTNVCVLNSGQFAISSTTLPGYFEKDTVGDIYLDASNDMMLFLQIAKAMNVKTRFAGSEPIDKFTNQYNRNMRTYLERYGISFVEIEREQLAGEVISASSVRRSLERKDFASIRQMVPETTYQYLLEKYGEKQ